MKTLIALAIIVTCCQPLSAGDIWMGCGGGFGSEGFAATVNGSVQIGSHGLIGVRWLESWQLDRINDDGWFSGESFNEGAGDVGLLVGLVRTDSQRKNLISVSVGFGSVTVTRKGEWDDGGWFESAHWDKAQVTTTGLLLQSQVFFGKFGILTFADFNSAASFGGVVFSWRPFVFNTHR